MNAIALLLVLLMGYALGNIQSGLLVARFTRNLDLREHGSGSSGATNVLRVLGRKPAIVTLVSDILKGAVAALLGWLCLGFHGALACGFMVVVGHIFPVLYNFKGGKGIATAFGVLLVVTPLYGVIVGIIAVLLMYFTKLVSLADVIAASSYLVIGVIVGIVRADWQLVLFAVCMPAVVIFAHRKNIARLLNGTEKQMGLSGEKKS